MKMIAFEEGELVESFTIYYDKTPGVIVQLLFKTNRGEKKIGNIVTGTYIVFDDDFKVNDVFLV